MKQAIESNVFEKKCLEILILTNSKVYISRLRVLNISAASVNVQNIKMD